MINFEVKEVFLNQFFILFVSVFAGIALGSVRIGNFKLGFSGPLFSSILISYFLNRFLIIPEVEKYGADTPAYILSAKSSKLIPTNLFTFSLIIFISSTGLMASHDFGPVFKKYGIKFIFLGIIVTFSGYLTMYLGKVITNSDLDILKGVFSGSLTSSPGLGSALENSKSLHSSSDISFGYTLSYIPGVLGVILSMSLLPSIFKINIDEEKKEFSRSFPSFSKDSFLVKNKGFDYISYSLVTILGIALGTFSLNLGKIKNLSLGITGGVLISSLVLGSLKRFWKFNFVMDVNTLKFLQNLGLVFFLSSIGLQNGYDCVSKINKDSLVYLVISFLIILLSILVGFLIGRYVFNLNWILLSGAICGAMTSTPGLGAASETVGSDQVAISYGAVYPFALVCMVVLLIF